MNVFDPNDGNDGIKRRGRSSIHRDKDLRCDPRPEWFVWDIYFNNVTMSQRCSRHFVIHEAK
ncbi:MAG: hypothetical protein ABR582_15580 [Gemmatimonadaceae bacterium]